MPRNIGSGFISAAIIALSLAFAGAASAQMKTHDQVQFISGSPTGSWFPVASAMSELTNQVYDGQPISVVPGAGGVGNPLRVGTGQSDIGISYGPFLKLAQQGGNELYKEAFPKLRAISGMTANKLHLVTDTSTDAANLGALKSGKPSIRVGTGPKGSTELFTMGEVLKEYGVQLNEIDEWGGRVDRLNTAGRSDAWQNRQLDLVNFFINNPAAKVIELMSGRPNSALVTIDDQVRDALVSNWGMIKFTIPAGQYPGQDADVQTVGMPYVYFTTTDLDDDFVYEMTKTIAENHERLMATHSSFKGWSPEGMHAGLGIELHEGAKRYYRERGWIQ
jgi:TRAP transporter TAXI family solute receptor